MVPSVERLDLVGGPYAASQLSSTRQMLCVAAEVDLDPLRVGGGAGPAGAGVAVEGAAAGVPAFSVDDAVEGLFSAALVVPQRWRRAGRRRPKTWNSHSE